MALKILSDSRRAQYEAIQKERKTLKGVFGSVEGVVKKFASVRFNDDPTLEDGVSQLKYAQKFTAHPNRANLRIAAILGHKISRAKQKYTDCLSLPPSRAGSPTPSYDDLNLGLEELCENEALKGMEKLQEISEEIEFISLNLNENSPLFLLLHGLIQLENFVKNAHNIVKYLPVAAYSQFEAEFKGRIKKITQLEKEQHEKIEDLVFTNSLLNPTKMDAGLQEEIELFLNKIEIGAPLSIEEQAHGLFLKDNLKTQMFYNSPEEINLLKETLDIFEGICKDFITTEALPLFKNICNLRTTYVKKIAPFEKIDFIKPSAVQAITKAFLESIFNKIREANPLDWEETALTAIQSNAEIPGLRLTRHSPEHKVTIRLSQKKEASQELEKRHASNFKSIQDLLSHLRESRSEEKKSRVGCTFCFASQTLGISMLPHPDKKDSQLLAVFIPQGDRNSLYEPYLIECDDTHFLCEFLIHHIYQNTEELEETEVQIQIYVRAAIQ